MVGEATYEQGEVSWGLGGEVISLMRAEEAALSALSVSFSLGNHGLQPLSAGSPTSFLSRRASLQCREHALLPLSNFMSPLFRPAATQISHLQL